MPAGAALLAADEAEAQVVGNLTPFVQSMPIIAELPARATDSAGFGPVPTVAPNRAINPSTRLPFEGRGDAHQHRNLAPPQTFYVERYAAVPPVSIHPQLPPQVGFWGANRGSSNLTTDRPTTPLPTVVARYKAGANTAVLIRRYNQLPLGAPIGGFGRNEITAHTHNFHSGPDSDGGPCDPSLGADSQNATTQGRFFFPGQYYDYYYNMKRAGFTNPGTPDGDVRETLSTLWYHDHREGHTFENVYKGLYGFFLAFNEYDTGNERTGFRLPSYPAFDIPIAIVDLKIDPLTGQATVDLSNTDGHLGTQYLVNGRVRPYLDVLRRRYRLRLLNVGPSRFLQLHLTNPDNPAQVIPFWQITHDGNLLSRPLQVNNVRLSVANRVDVIIDFAKLAAQGVRRLRLDNRLVQTNPRGPDDTVAPPGLPANGVMELRIGGAATDRSADPATIASFAPISLPPIPVPVVTRRLRFERRNGQWAVNGRFIDCNQVRFVMKRNRPERWIISGGGGWSHPIHMHMLEGRLVRRNGVAIPPTSPEFSRMDVIWLGGGDEVEYIVRPQDYVGVYPLHCHNVVHEDHAMMLLLRINDVGDTVAEP